MYFGSKSPKSPKKFDFSPKSKYDYINNSEQSKNNTFMRSYSKNSNESYSYDSPRSPKYHDRSPKSPRKFEYDSVSPKFEKSKFIFKMNVNQIFNLLYSYMYVEFDYVKTPKHSNNIEPLKKYCKSSNEHSSHPVSPKHFSENFSYDMQVSTITESEISADSEATTAILSTSSGIGGSVCISNATSDEKKHFDFESEGEHEKPNIIGHRRRRHAINITSNPGYQVINS